MFRALFIVAAGAALMLTPAAAQSADPTCPTDTFLDVTQFEGAGDEYAKPRLSVTCDVDTMTVVSNNIPHYEFVQITPNPLVEQDVVTEIPRHPEYSDEPTALNLLGVTGVAVNGLAIFGPNEAAMPPDQAYGDPVYNSILDACLGHTASTYHYHALKQDCLSDGIGDGQLSPILGYALDGFPIYGPVGCLDAECGAVVTFVSGYTQVGDPTTYAWDAYLYQAGDDPAVLDECNGRILPDGTYAYHATATFPYVMGCYHGVIDASALSAPGAPGGQRPPRGDGPPTDGAPPPDGQRPPQG